MSMNPTMYTQLKTNLDDKFQTLHHIIEIMNSVIPWSLWNMFVE